jgi:hypothetical protein
MIMAKLTETAPRQDRERPEDFILDLGRQRLAAMARTRAMLSRHEPSGKIARQIEPIDRLMVRLSKNMATLEALEAQRKQEQK